MRTLRTSEAAAYLNVSPNTLRAWEQRFGFPLPQRSPGRHRLYSFAELMALREALSNGLAVSSAVSAARDATAADEYTLAAALLNFDYLRADRAMELALSMRTFESAVMRILVPALQVVDAKAGAGGAPWAFGSRWADEWLARSERLALAPTAQLHVLFADCFGERIDLDTIHARVLEVVCVRAGVMALRLPVGACRGLEHAMSGFAPEVLVLSGAGAPDECVATFARVVRCRAHRIACVHYRRPNIQSTPSQALSPSPLAARDEVLKRFRHVAVDSHDRWT
jgi:MerR family transcriptional regulator, light-induced transcriptional regulator